MIPEPKSLKRPDMPDRERRKQLVRSHPPEFIEGAARPGLDPSVSGCAMDSRSERHGLPAHPGAAKLVHPENRQPVEKPSESGRAARTHPKLLEQRDGTATHGFGELSDVADWS